MSRLSPDLIERARAVPIERIAPAGLQREGRDGSDLVGPCPRCGGTDRFRVSTRRQLFHCRQCGAKGNVIALAQLVYGLDFRGAVERLTGQRDDDPLPARPAQPPERQRDGGMHIAAKLWREAQPLYSDGEAWRWYAARGIDLSRVPDQGGLRFHATCPYGEGQRLPCIVARLTDAVTGAERGIHRRPIVPGIEPKTRMLGPSAGCVVRLWPDEDVTQGLVIGEGLETTLAAATRITHRKTLLQPAWATCTAGLMEAFPVLSGIDVLTILCDHDENGVGQRAADICARRWAKAGREVEILTPRHVGADMNDVIRGAA